MFKLLTLVTLSLLGAQSFVFAFTRPSATPSTYTCPSEDIAGFPLGTSVLTSIPIFCSYPAFAGEDPNDFFCTYSATTGQIVQGHDAGFCPPTATTITSRRRANRVARNPLPSRPSIVRGVPAGISEKAYLKKKRRAHHNKLA